MSTPQDQLPTLVIAGATGFVGSWFIENFHEKYRIIGLSRAVMEEDPRPNVEWRQVEMYSLSSMTDATIGADYALYLVHSMGPSTRLHQGNFEDTDLLLADNFARAAEVNGIQHIVYMGGLLPTDTDEYSRHLRSRLEVEQTLGSTGVATTALRAGIIVGPGGSSFKMVRNLIARLPVLVCPSWTRTSTDPIALPDALRIIDYCLGNESTYNRAIGIAGSRQTNYQEMLAITARVMDKKRLIIPMPYLPVGLSKLWVSLITGSSLELVGPLVESLEHEMVAKDNDVLDRFPDRMDYEAAARYALEHEDQKPFLPERIKSTKEKNTVRSVQRLPNPYHRKATWVARMYQHWLPRFFRALLTVENEGDSATFKMFGVPLLKLQFINDRSDDRRQLFYVVDGRLVKRRDYGWLEFRNVLDDEYVISAIHEFVPNLPWFIYVVTQARIHEWVMQRFGKFLAKRGDINEPIEAAQG
ncbi:epimerase [Lewinellaceae bacterium SD302]|nr:epimerase [Lewinellaceae bacterium SD302]